MHHVAFNFLGYEVLLCLSSLPLLSDGKKTTTLQNLQHLSYQVKLTGVTCTNNASSYSAVVTLLPIVGSTSSLLTPNAEVHIDIM